MFLSDIGAFAENNFTDIADKIKLLEIDGHIVMPGHIHLIITIPGAGTGPKESHFEECSYATGLQPLQKKIVTSFMNHFKGKIKYWCNHNIHPEFEWQARFHYRIMRHEKEYDATVLYISNNVLNWKS